MSLAHDGLPKLSDVVRSHGLEAKKSLGQNFLLDLQLTAKIARAGGPLKGVCIVEIGPGPGGLTRGLLSQGADHVIAIERDARCRPALAAIADHYPGRLTLIEGDAMEIDYQAVAPPGARLVANLPYNIATPLLTGWLSSQDWPSWWSSMTLLFQREVAERLVARPGDKAYGRLSVLCGWRSIATKLFDIPASAFTPPPKVTSTLVHFEPKGDAEAAKISRLEAVTAAAFGQRRKMLRSSLKPLTCAAFPTTQDLIEAAGLTATDRAEVVPVDAYLRLAQLLDEALNAPGPRPTRLPPLA